MALGRKKKDDPRSMWQSGQDAAPKRGALSTLRNELSQSAGGVLGPARVALGQSSQSLPVRLVSLAEVLADASATPIGRLVTATASLFLAWLLL